MISTSELPKSARRFGRWVLHDGCLCLPDGPVAYEIPVSELLVLPRWWIAHMAGKGWVTAGDIADLRTAIGDLRTRGQFGKAQR